MQHDNIQNLFDLLTQLHESRACARNDYALHGALHSVPFSLFCNMTTFRFLFSFFDPTPGIEVVCKDGICACVVLYALFPIICMQHDYIQNLFDLLTRLHGSRACARNEYALHGALHSVPFSLICKMTTFRKKSFDFLTLPQG